MGMKIDLTLSEYENKVLRCAEKGEITIRYCGLSNFQSLKFHVNKVTLFWDGMNLVTPRYMLLPFVNTRFDIRSRFRSYLERVRQDKIAEVERQFEEQYKDASLVSLFEEAHD